MYMDVAQQCRGQWATVDSCLPPCTVEYARRQHLMASSPLTGAQTAKIEKAGIGGIGFDRLMMVLCCWFVGGLYLDGWAHDHGMVDKTFFTPWHAVLYSGYFAC